VGEWRYSSTILDPSTKREWSVTRPGPYTPGRAPFTHRIGGSVAPRAGPNWTLWSEESLASAGNRIANVQPVAIPTELSRLLCCWYLEYYVGQWPLSCVSFIQAEFRKLDQSVIDGRGEVILLSWTRWKELVQWSELPYLYLIGRAESGPFCLHSWWRKLIRYPKQWPVPNTEFVLWLNHWHRPLENYCRYLYSWHQYPSSLLNRMRLHHFTNTWFISSTW
jgi:hypothetical protein